MTEDIYTEPEVDTNTLANLGPLTGMAGIWEGTAGADVHPIAGGPEADAYVERYELQPIDPQTNGPQYFYGLRYHKHITKPGEVETFHDQVGYWLWNPVEETVTLTIAIPRAQVALASGRVTADATTFSLHAERGTTEYGICSNPFLERAYTTLSFDVTVTVHPDGTWGYDEDTVLRVLDHDEPFHHTDRHTLHKVADAEPNPLAR
ncbi:MAG: heme-binding beta-barrel domain-containing protein [Acidimicrobiia bacterium]